MDGYFIVHLCAGWLFLDGTEYSSDVYFREYEPRQEKTYLRGVRPGKTQPGLLSHTRERELKSFGPRQANLVFIAYASSEGSGEPAHPRSLARTSAARSYKQWVKRNLQTEIQILGPSEWLGMRS